MSVPQFSTTPPRQYSSMAAPYPRASTGLAMDIRLGTYGNTPRNIPQYSTGLDTGLGVGA
eukprot:827113-Rhodomonas_salina.1